MTEDILLALIESRAGRSYDVAMLHRDAQGLYNTGRFSAVIWETEPGRVGALVRFVVSERPVTQAIEYQGDDTVAITEIVARLDERKIKLKAETLYHEEELGRATRTIQELLSEKGQRNFTVTPVLEPIGQTLTWPPAEVKVIFRVEKQP